MVSLTNPTYSAFLDRVFAIYPTPIIFKLNMSTKKIGVTCPLVSAVLCTRILAAQAFHPLSVLGPQ